LHCQWNQCGLSKLHHKLRIGWIEMINSIFFIVRIGEAVGNAGAPKKCMGRHYRCRPKKQDLQERQTVRRSWEHNTSRMAQIGGVKVFGDEPEEILLKNRFALG
jgi:hypothetical protein